MVRDGHVQHPRASSVRHYERAHAEAPHALYDYSGGVFGDQHARFRARLKETTRLVVAGYGFGDKGINRVVIDWVMSPGDKRLVVVHPDPQALAGSARPAIGGKWTSLATTGRLVAIPAGIEHLDWPQVAALF
jgi:hypothetical protein